MSRLTVSRLLLTSLVVIAPALSPAHAQDAAAALNGALKALNGPAVKTLRIAGHGSDYVVGQMYDGHSPWPAFEMPSYTMTVDYAASAMRTERTRRQVTDQRGGALQPLVGEQRLVQAVNGTFAWNETDGKPGPAGTGGAVRGESPGVGLHTPTASEERLLQIWLTPHGFLQAALANKAETRSETIRGVKKTVVTFTTPIKLTLEGVLNERQRLERVETWIAHPVLGDTMIEAVFLDYKDFGGLTFPGRITYREGGYPAFDLTVTEVVANVPAAIEVPPGIKQAAAPAPAPLLPQQIADGVWFCPGGSQSVVVEFRDHLVVIDAPVDEQRSIQVIDAIRKTISKKPIRYVVNTHLHFDHVGGLRAYAAEGANIVTQHDNIAYLEQVLGNPRTIGPDRLSKSARKIQFEGVVGARTLTDGARELVLYHYPGNAHNSGMLMAFLPKEKVLFEADSYIPGRPGAPHPAVPNLLQFYAVVQRLRLDVEQILPSHGRVATFEELQDFIEKSKPAR